MNLKDFERYFDSTILDRGWSYYQSGNVISLEYAGKEWKATVHGSRAYKVTASVSETGDISDTECNCPYDMGDLCKHQAAVFYALWDRLQRGNVPKEDQKRESLEDVLERLDKRTLLSIVMEFAGRDEQIEKEIMLRHSETTDLTASARSIIQSSIRDAEYHGMIRYGDAEYAIEGAETVLKLAANKIKSGDIPAAVSLCVTVSEEMMFLLNNCDDSDGDVGGAVYDAAEMIEEAVSKPMAREDGERMFGIVFDHAMSTTFDGWGDQRMDLLFALAPLCGIGHNRERMEEYISEKQDAETDGWGGEYDEHQMQVLQHDIIKRFDGESAADSYIERHLSNNDLRIIGIENAMNRGSYRKAAELCSGGEIENSQYRVLVERYKELRFEAYEKMGEVEEMKDLGFELLTKGGITYLPRIRPLYKEDEWPAVLQKILKKLNTWERREVYAEVLIAEGLRPLLLEYCREYVGYIEWHYAYLLPEYKTDVCEIFNEHIRKSAARAGVRNEYRGVCRIIELYKKVCGDNAHLIRDELKRTYSKRPAFVDELSRL